MSTRVAWSAGRWPKAKRQRRWRVARLSRQAIYRTPTPRKTPQCGPAAAGIDTAIVEVARNNPTDGTCTVAVLTSRKLDLSVSRAPSA